MNPYSDYFKSFDTIQPLWLAWGLYLSTCWEHDIEFDSTELPYDYISNYERSELDKDLRLYGGEVGIFKEVEANVKMLSEIYHEMLENNLIEPITNEMLANPLFNDIAKGNFKKDNNVLTGDSGVQWGKTEFQNGIFSYNELEYIQKLLSSDIGIRWQFTYLSLRLYCYENKISVQKINLIPNLEPKAKCFLATFLYWNDLPIYWFDDFIAEGNNIQTLEDTADYIIGIFDDEMDKRTIEMFDYINTYLEGIV